MSTEDSSYRLIFDGPVDSSSETLRKLKGFLIADLQLSVTEVQNILENPPAVIKSADNEQDLQKLVKRLSEAGAKVSIAKPANMPEEATPDAGLTDLDNTLWIEELQNTESLSSGDVTETVSLEFDADEVTEIARIREPAEPKPIPTYELNLDEEADSQPLFSFNQEEQEAAGEEAPAEKPTAPAGGGIFDLTIEDTPLEEPPSVMSFQDSGESAAEDDLGIKFDTAPAPAPEPERVEPPKSTIQFDEPGDKQAPPATPPAPAASAKNAAPQAPPSSGLSLESAEATPPASTPQEKPPAPPAEHTGTQAPPAEQQPAEAAKHDESTMKLGDRFKKQERKAIPEATPRQEEAASDEEAQEEIPAEKTASKQGRNMWPLLGLVVVIMGVANWWIFGAPTDKTAENIERISREVKEKLASSKSKSSDTPAAAITPTATAEPIAEPSIQISGQSSAAGISGSLELISDGLKLMYGKAQLSTEQPRDLTPEEIVANKKRPPWITRVEIDMPKLPDARRGDFSWSGPAKIYIDYDGRRDRMVGDASVSGTFTVSDKKVISDITVMNGLKERPANDALIAETSPEGGYKIYMRLPVVADQVKSIVTPTAAPTAAAAAKTSDDSAASPTAAPVGATSAPAAEKKNNEDLGD